MSDLLARIDNATAGLCPCGADPRPGSAYCGPDCEPTHISDDTDPRDHGWLSTPMRWRPDLVTAADDTDLIPLGSETHGYAGRFNAQVYERASAQETWHLRLDDGHRFVGLDLTDVGGRQDPITEELVGRVREAWQRLERELTNAAHQWAGWSDVGHVDETDDPWADVMPALLSHGQAVVIVHPSGDRRAVRCAVIPQVDTRARRSYHNQGVQAVDVSAADLESFARVARQSVRPLTAEMESLLRDMDVHLTDWQRQMVEQMFRVRLIQPRRFGLSVGAAAVRAQPRAFGFRPMVNAREAAIFAERGLREGVDFLRYPEAPPADEPPTDPMLRAIEAKKNRNTGPPQDRLDGRRRRRR